jgi:hypothetical protein
MSQSAVSDVAIVLFRSTKAQGGSVGVSVGAGISVGGTLVWVELGDAVGIASVFGGRGVGVGSQADNASAQITKSSFIV